MLKIYYLNFCETLKKFIENEKFCIRCEIFGELYELSYDIRDEHFRFIDGRILFPKIDDVYQIIKFYVINQITKKQKEALNGSFDKKTFQELNLNFEEEKQKNKFFKLLKIFEKYLLEEPIFFEDITNDIEKIKLGFSDTKVSDKFLLNMLNTIIRHPESLENGKISCWMWNNVLVIVDLDIFKESLEVLEEDGYFKLDEEKFKFNIFDVLLTEKFYNALKLTIFNEVFSLNYKKTIVISKF